MCNLIISRIKRCQKGARRSRREISAGAGSSGRLHRIRGKMPISKSKKHLYGKDWKMISAIIRLRSGNECEICDARNGYPHPKTGSKVVLTVHHLDFNAANREDWNLIAVCQRCNNRLDVRWRVRNRAINKQLKECLIPRKMKKGDIPRNITEAAALVRL